MSSTLSPIAAHDTARPIVSLPLIMALVVFLGGVMSTSVLSDADSYWHVAAGRWILQHRAVPLHDVFSHSITGVAWTAHEWLSEVVLYSAFQQLGWHGVQWLASACFAITAGYMLRFLCDRMEPVHAISTCVVCLSLMYTHFLARPHVLVWPLTALWVGALVAAGEARRAPPWWLLIVLLFWTNLHGSFILAIGLAGVLAADATWQLETRSAQISAIRRWAAFLVACGACVLINPRGFGAIQHAVGMMHLTTMLAVVEEWKSADFHEFQPFVIWLGLVLALAFSGRLRLPIVRGLLVIGLLYIALKHQRYHALLGLVSPFLLAMSLAEGLRDQTSRVTADNGSDRAAHLDRVFHWLARPARAWSVAAAIAFAGAAAFAAREIAPSGPPTSTTPTRALAAFQAMGVQGRVLNGYAFGGYLIFREIPVFIDGRSDMYGDAFLTETGRALSLSSPAVLENLLEKYRIGWTLLEPRTPAVELLNHLEGWERVFSDSTAVVHVRRSLLPHAAVSSR